MSVRLSLVSIVIALAGCGGASHAASSRTVAEEAFVECDGQVASYANGPVAREGSLDLRLSTGGALRYLGASEDAAFLEAAFHEFRPTVVYHDGSGAVIGALASQSRIPAQLVEPTVDEQVLFLRQHHDSDQVKLFFVLREIARLNDVEQMPLGELLEATAQAVVRANDLPGLDGVVRDMAELESSYVRYFGTEHHWSEIPATWFDPAQDPASGGRFVTEMSASLSRFRDLHAYRTVATAALEGERVFAVVAEARAPMQAPALVCALDGR